MSEKHTSLFQRLLNRVRKKHSNIQVVIVSGEPRTDWGALSVIHLEGASLSCVEEQSGGTNSPSRVTEPQVAISPEWEPDVLLPPSSSMA